MKVSRASEGRLSGKRIIAFVWLLGLAGCGSDPFASSDGTDASPGVTSDAAVEAASIVLDDAGSDMSATTPDALAVDTGSMQVPDGPVAALDAMAPVDDGAVAAAQCAKVCETAGIGTCAGGECVIRCDDQHACNGIVECPIGIPCRVLCASSGSCAGGIDCTGATSCDIHCNSPMSCAGNVQCSGERCTVACAEQGTCPRAVTCDANDCELSCTGASSCNAGVSCLATAKKCNIECGGSTSCAGAVRGSGVSDLRCSGFGSCGTSVSCGGDNCAIECVINQSCGGAVCCQAGQCSYTGTNRRCQ
jgi:hypothetical protein